MGDLYHMWVALSIASASCRNTLVRQHRSRLLETGCCYVTLRCYVTVVMPGVRPALLGWTQGCHGR